jgi:hypothetical protein
MTVRSFPDHLLFDGMLHVDAAPLFLTTAPEFITTIRELFHPIF